MVILRKRDPKQAFWSSYVADPKRNVPPALAELLHADEARIGPDDAADVLDFLRTECKFPVEDSGDGNAWLPVEVLPV